MTRDSRQVLTEWLVLSAQAGNESALAELFALWREDLRRFALVRLEHHAAADDVLADAWLSIARGLRRLDDPACFPRWAFRIVERRSMDWLRRRSLERRREVEAANMAEEIAPAPATPPETPAELLRLRAAIARLPPEQSELLYLYYDLDRSVAEIAEVLAIPPGTVKSRLFSLRENLKRQLEMNVL